MFSEFLKVTMSASNQGKQFSQHWNQFYQENKPKYIHEGSIEGFQSKSTTKSNTKPELLYQGQPQLESLMKQFDSVFDEYQKNVALLSTMDHEYNQILLRNNQLPSSVDMYLGKIVVDEHGEHYYITRFGHKRKFNAQSWMTRDTTCSTSSIPRISATDMEFMLSGPDMNAFEPCGKEGKIVREGTTQNYKWVDIQGYGHRFPTANQYMTTVTQQKCPREYDTLPSDRYNAIAGGPDMDDGDACSVVITDNSKKTRLLQQKQLVTTKLEELISLINQIESHDGELNKQFQDRRTELAIAVSNLKNEAKNEVNVKNDNESLRAKWDTIVVQERMEYYQYLGLAAVGVVITGAMLHQMFSR